MDDTEKAQAPDLEVYASSEDEDFRPDDAPDAHESDESSSEGGANDRGKQQDSSRGHRKRRPLDAPHGDDGGLEVDDFANSGDEATIRRGKKRLRKGSVEDDDLGGEGGLIKTRAQRAQEAKERKPLADASKATVDVDALWASMQAAEKPAPAPVASEPSVAGEEHHIKTPNDSGHDTATATAPALPKSKAEATSSTGQDMITIKRSYDFAGETITEEKLVPKTSAEAQLFLRSQQPTVASGAQPLRKPKKRTSMFDPKMSTSTKVAATKLNTIEKSKLDWAGYVDKAGIADELDEHSRAKEGYLGRMDFLGRVEAKKEEELRELRKK